MARVRRSTYRQPVTPKGLEKIEKGELQWFDTEMYSNLNTEVLEEYLDHKNRSESFKVSSFKWYKLFLVIILVGLPFTVISQYIALKIGLVTGGAFYVSYLVGMMFRWKPSQVNIASGSATATDRTVTGFVFTFPSIYLLAYSSQYFMSNNQPLIPPSLIESSNIVPVAMVASLFASLLGMMYFIIFRRLWQVEDPLPAPGFQAFVKLLDISSHLSEGGVEQAKRSIKKVGASFAGMFIFAFLRDFPLIGENGFSIRNGTTPILTWVMSSIGFGNWFTHGRIHLPYSMSKYTHVAYEFTGIGFAIGWFMKARASIIVAAGSLVTWFVIVPIAVILDVPIYVPILEQYGSGYLSTHALPIGDSGLSEYIPYPAPAFGAAQGIAKIIAIGAILGGGTTALLKMLPTFRTVIKDISKTKGGEKKEWVAGKGWYEWPTQHIFIVMGVALVTISLIFWLFGGFPIIPSIVFAILLVFLTFMLGAIAVKISGEIGTTPVSGTSFLTLIILFLVFSLIAVFLPFPEGKSQIVLMALVGTTVFGSAISLSSEIMWDFKAGLYAGTRPMHLIKGESVAILFGTPAAALAAAFFSMQLAKGQLDLEAPQATAFAVFVQILAGGKVMYSLFILGVSIGVFVEMISGMGTAFGLGMYLPLQYTLMLLTGGFARELWEKKWLNRKAKEENWGEDEKTFKLLDSYMLMTGLYIGEAIIGTLLAVWLVIPK
ncbi:MAG: OPT/YSL family transporter [Thermoplasmatota archaeon]